jgi:hypothetical protein
MARRNTSRAYVGTDGSRGFAAKVGEKVLSSVSTWGKDYQVLVEEDQEVHQMGGGIGL